MLLDADKAGEPAPIINVTSVKALETLITGLADDELLVLDFWAPWCGPCKTLGPTLERLAAKYAPRVKLAKINVDEQQMLAAQFRVQSIPAVMFIRQGKMVDHFVGAQPAAAIESFIQRHLPAPAEQEDLAQSAQQAINAGNWQQAREFYARAQAAQHDSPDLQLGTARCALALGDFAAAREALSTVTNPKRADERDRLASLADTFERLQSEDHEAIAARAKAEPSNLGPAYDWACALAAGGDYDTACEALLQIITQDSKALDGAPRKALLGLFDLLGNAHPRVPAYRSRLASALFV
jgi:putative thioredoxin